MIVVLHLSVKQQVLYCSSSCVNVKGRMTWLIKRKLASFIQGLTPLCLVLVNQRDPLGNLWIFLASTVSEELPL